MMGIITHVVAMLLGLPWGSPKTVSEKSLVGKATAPKQQHFDTFVMALGDIPPHHVGSCFKPLLFWIHPGEINMEAGKCLGWPPTKMEGVPKIVVAHWRSTLVWDTRQNKSLTSSFSTLMENYLRDSNKQIPATNSWRRKTWCRFFKMNESSPCCMQWHVSTSHF